MAEARPGLRNTSESSLITSKLLNMATCPQLHTRTKKNKIAVDIGCRRFCLCVPRASRHMSQLCYRQQ